MISSLPLISVNAFVLLSLQMCPEPAHSASTCSAEKSTRTCADLQANAGWPADLFGLNHQPQVCGSSGKITMNAEGEPEVDCLQTQAVDFHMAVEICVQMGARLCSIEEMQRDEARGTGCGFDAAAVWTSTRYDCPEGPPNRTIARCARYLGSSPT